MTDIATIMQTSAVIPVLVIDDAATAKPQPKRSSPGACAFSRLRCVPPAAMEAIREMKTCPGAIVGAAPSSTKRRPRR